MADAPIACTLPSSTFKTRLSELAELTRSALLSARRDDLTLHLRYAPEAAERVQHMAKKEQVCCAFLTFTFRETASAIELSIVAPEAARNGVKEIYAQFLLNKESFPVK